MESAKETTGSDAAREAPPQGAAGFTGTSKSLMRLKPSEDLKLDDSPFSIQVWVKRARTRADDTLVSQGEAGRLSGVSIGYSKEDTLEFELGEGEELSLPGFGADGQKWIHLTATFEPESRTQTIFRNGGKIGSRVASGKIGEYTDADCMALLTLEEQALAGACKKQNRLKGDILIGQRSNGKTGEQNPFKGSLDELRIWKQELDPVTVLETFDVNIEHRSGLVGSYTFDDTSNLGMDKSGHGNQVNIAQDPWPDWGYWPVWPAWLRTWRQYCPSVARWAYPG